MTQNNIDKVLKKLKWKKGRPTKYNKVLMKQYYNGSLVDIRIGDLYSMPAKNYTYEYIFFNGILDLIEEINKGEE